MSMAMLGWDLISDERMDELRAIAAVRPLTADDLPESDGMPLDSAEQRLLIDLLTEPLDIHWAERPDVFITGNQFLYFSVDQVFHRDFIGPDVLVATGVPRGTRRSYVVWQEGKPPDVAIEILSPSTARHDRTAKRRIYQDQVQVPEYYWIDPDTGESAGWRLMNGQYVSIEPDAQGCYWCAVLNLWLVPWQGMIRDYSAFWLRWADADGRLLPSAAERAEANAAAAVAERERADANAAAAQTERERADLNAAAAVAERERAEAERRRAEAAERELAELRALLAQRQPPDELPSA